MVWNSGEEDEVIASKPAIATTSSEPIPDIVFSKPVEPVNTGSAEYDFTVSAGPVNVKAEPIVPVSQPSIVSSSSQVSQKFLDSLLSKLGASGSFGLIKFYNMLTKLRDKPLSESEKYDMAFSTAQVVGASVSSLKGDAQLCSQALDVEETNYKQWLDSQLSIQVNSKQQSILEMDATIKAHVEQIESLNKEIESMQSKKIELAQDIAASKMKLETGRDSFAATIKFIRNVVINDTVSKIDLLLKDTQP